MSEDASDLMANRSAVPGSVRAETALRVLQRKAEPPGAAAALGVTEDDVSTWVRGFVLAGLDGLGGAGHGPAGGEDLTAQKRELQSALAEAHHDLEVLAELADAHRA